MVSGQELGGDSGKIDLILCDQIVIKHSREKKESEVKLKTSTPVATSTSPRSPTAGRGCQHVAFDFLVGNCLIAAPQLGKPAMRIVDGLFAAFDCYIHLSLLPIENARAAGDSGQLVASSHDHVDAKRAAVRIEIQQRSVRDIE